MRTEPKPITILIADDDQDDRLLIREAFIENKLPYDVRFVEDGEALMDYLLQRGKYSASDAAPGPGLILLDLNMPGMDGREVLKEIRANARLRHIPIVVLTTSHEAEDIYQSYTVGANSFITKPNTFEAISQLINSIGKYWLEIVELPRDKIDV
ncbi:MAG: response regulator [Syntrophobacter sp.]